MAKLKIRPDDGDARAFIVTIVDDEQGSDCEAVAGVMATASVQSVSKFGGSIVGHRLVHY